MSGKKRSKRVVASSRSAAPAADPEVARLQRLLALMDEHALAELEVGADGSVRLSKVGPASYAVAAPAAVAPLAAPAAAPAAAAPGASGGKAKATSDGEKFLSPMVGTFYRAASPEAKAFVVEGDVVKAESVLCIIEAMKVMNEIKAERAGKVVQILVENGEAVEYGQPLFILQRT
jgi:acetyl-CoA carboxylase biotin carboxyl carrier protein